MDKALLQQSMKRWNALYGELRAGLIPRQELPDIPSLDLGLAISGVRRCGKTTLAVQSSRAFAEDRVLYYNFEDPLFLDVMEPTAIDGVLDIYLQTQGSYPELTILDEIQNVRGWERWLRTAIDQKRSRFIVTGSNSKLLSADLSTSLTGRSLEHTTWPLTLSEASDFLKQSQRSSHKSSQRSYERSFCLNKLLYWGGMPAVLLISNEVERERLLRQYLSDLVHRDIINRHEIRNKRALDILLTYYQTNLSSLHSYSAIKKAFGIPVDTVAEYTATLSEAFLVFEVERFHRNLKVQSRDPRKVYVVDAGLRRVSARSAEADIGKLLENLVYLDLRRRRKTVFYYQQHSEVDFIVTSNYSPEAAIQVCAYGMDVTETRTREVSSLLSCLKDLELKEGTIITMDRNEIIEAEGKIIRSVAATDWLL